MDIFSFLGERGSPPSPTDEVLYEFIAAELVGNMVKQGLWTKALADSHWDEPKAKAVYVKMRLIQLRDELHSAFVQRQAALFDQENLSAEEAEYLGTAILASRYIEKYGVSREKLSKAIGVGKIRGVICDDVLWVQDKKFS